MKVKITLQNKALSLILTPETKEEKVLLELAPSKTFYCKKLEGPDEGTMELETTSL